jgi:hypothetical protein
VRILGIDDPYLNLLCIQIKNAGAMAEAGKVNLHNISYPEFVLFRK